MNDRGGLIMQFGPLAGPALLADWAEARDLPFTLFRADLEQELPPIAGLDWLALLGSKFTPQDDCQEVRQARAAVEAALAADVPVLGLCFGGQVLASALGAEIVPLAQPELGWIEVESDEPGSIPQGPWLAWHWFRFQTPSTAVEVARNAVGPQVFRQGPHLGVQFHPECTIEVVASWVDHYAEKLPPGGVEERLAMLEAGRDDADLARLQAWQLFDGFAGSVPALATIGARPEEVDDGAP